MVPEKAEPTGPQRVAVVIPCQDARKYIAGTVRACRAIPSVDLIVVVDDGSADDTSQVARSAGAVAVRHSVVRGRASALETGVKVVAMRDREDWPSRNLLFLSPDLGDSAVEANALVEAVNDKVADCAIGISPEEARAVRTSRHSVAWNAIRKSTGWDPAEPLSLHRCMTREAVTAVMPFAAGWGVDAGMTMDLLEQGFSVMEIPCNFQRLGTPEQDPIAQRRARYWDTWIAVKLRRLRRPRVKLSQRLSSGPQEVGAPYRLRERDSQSSD